MSHTMQRALAHYRGEVEARAFAKVESLRESARILRDEALEVDNFNRTLATELVRRARRLEVEADNSERGR